MRHLARREARAVRDQWARVECFVEAARLSLHEAHAEVGAVCAQPGRVDAHLHDRRTERDAGRAPRRHLTRRELAKGRQAPLGKTWMTWQSVQPLAGSAAIRSKCVNADSAERSISPSGPAWYGYPIAAASLETLQATSPRSQVPTANPARSCVRAHDSPTTPVHRNHHGIPARRWPVLDSGLTVFGESRWSCAGSSSTSCCPAHRQRSLRSGRRLGPSSTGSREASQLRTSKKRAAWSR